MKCSINGPILAVLALVAAAGATARANDATPDLDKPRVVKTETIKPDPEPTEAATTGAAKAEADKAEAARTEAAKTEAAKANSDFTRRLFARDVTQGKKSYACFVRQYDSAHLARHPQQKVSAMRLLVTAEIVPEDDKLNHSFRLGLKFRDKSAAFESAGECGHADVSETPGAKPQLGCGVDCDGGGLTVEMDGDSSVMVRLERLRLWLKDKPDDESHHELDGGVDDRAFRLARAPLAMCKSLANDREELAAIHLK